MTGEGEVGMIRMLGVFANFIVAFLAFAGMASAGSSATVVIVGEVPPWLEVDIPDSLKSWEITADDDGTYITVGDITVKSNTNWSLYARENDGDGKLSNDGDEPLKKALRIKADHGRRISLSGEDEMIASGIATQETTLTITYSQKVYKDEVDDENYGIAVMFTGRMAA